MNREKLRRFVVRRLQECATVKLLLLERSVPVVEKTAAALIAALRRGNAIYLFGNGGSAADAQHFAAELQGTFYVKKRRPLPVMALTTNTSTLTAIANDIAYEQTFSRQVEAHVRKGDAVIALSTSGRSKNVLAAAKAARRKGATVIGFTGEHGGPLKRLCDICFCAPSNDVARIQECHGAVGHILCEIVESALSKK